MNGYFHGINTNEIPTSLLTPRKAMSALPIIFGCAPIHRVAPDQQEKAKPGSIQLIYSMEDAVAAYGIASPADDFENWTLSEAAYVYFNLFNTGPVVFANLFDPSVHKKNVSNETVLFTAGRGALQCPDVVGTAVLAPTDGGEAYLADVDYHLDPVSGEITIVDGGAMESAASALASYAYADPKSVTALDCIGGYDASARRTTGISLIDDVFPKYREVPTIALAPKFGENPAVAAILAAKVKRINTVLRGASAVVDLPSAGVNAIKDYSDAPSYKNRNGLTSECMILCWPKTKVGDRTIRLSLLTGARMAATDADNSGIPYVSPSNKSLPITACVVDGEEAWLGLDKINYIDGNGIVTVSNFQGGWRLWGNHTACFPDNRDPKDYFIPARRMMSWYANHLVLTWWERVDWPMARRLVETIANSEQYHLNSLVSAGVLHGGRIELLESENGILDLMDGQITFHVWLGITPPAERIIFNLEFDPSTLATLFSVAG